MDIRPYEKNAKKHPDKQLKQIAASLKEFGWQQPIVVDKNGVIIVGHGRLAAYKKYPEGIKEPRIEVADLTEQQAKAYRLADNKLNESDWQMDLAIEELKGLDADMVELTGFDTDLLLEPDAKDDDIPENVPPVAKLGDLWQLGRHRLLCGDSAKESDVARLMGGVFADMVFTDPPWNVNYGNTAKDNPQGYKVRTIINDNMGEDFVPFLLSVFLVTNKFSKDGCPTYVVMSAQEWGGMMKAMIENGYHWSSTIIWKKDRLVMSRKDYHTQYEPIWYGWKDGSRLNPVLDRKQSDVWEVKRPSDSPLHPTTKPVELVERAIINSSKSGDVILEQFCGSGSTLIAAEKTGRICYGMELDPHYTDVIIKRWEDYTNQKATKIDG